MLNPGAEQELKLHEEMKLSVLLEGAHFGEMGVLHGGPRNVTVIADTFCMMEMLLGEDFIELLDNFPDIMRHVMKIAREKAEAQALVSTKTIEGHPFSSSFLFVKSYQNASFAILGMMISDVDSNYILLSF